jgi:hypothetical protein
MEEKVGTTIKTDLGITGMRERKKIMGIMAI